LGNTDKGAVGLCLDLDVDTHSFPEAVQALRDLLAEHPEGIPLDLEGAEHVRLYVNGDSKEIDENCIVDIPEE